MEENRNHEFFQNRQCTYFPCHEGVDEAEFNCLFCFCPLYALGKKCGGNFRYNRIGNKVCSDCTFPHIRENYEKIVGRYEDIKAVIGKVDGEEV